MLRFNIGLPRGLFLSWLDRWFISFLALWTLKQIHFWLSNFDSVWFSIQSYIMLHLWPKVSDRTRLATAWESILRSHCVAAWRKAAEGLGIGKGTTNVGLWIEVEHPSWTEKKWNKTTGHSLLHLTSTPRTAWCFERFMAMGVFESGVRPVYPQIIIYSYHFME